MSGESGAGLRRGALILAMTMIPVLTAILAVAAAAWSFAGTGQSTDLDMVFGFSFSTALVFCLAIMAPLTAIVEMAARPKRWLYPIVAGCFALWVATLLDGGTAVSTYALATVTGILSGLAWWWQVRLRGRWRWADG